MKLGDFDKIMILRTAEDSEFTFTAFKFIGMKICGDCFICAKNVPVDARRFYAKTGREHVYKIYVVVTLTTTQIQEADITDLTRDEVKGLINVGL